MRTMGERSGIAIAGLLLALGGCTSSGPDVEMGTERAALTKEASELLVQRWRGQFQFLSRSTYRGYPLRGLAAATKREGGDERTVEEADIVRHDTERGLIYALNPYRGLQIVDIDDPDAPRLTARERVRGRPVEMYAHGDFAVTLVEAPWSGEAPSGSLVIYDVGDPGAPTVAAEVAIEGSILGSHLLRTEDGGSAVLYVVAQTHDQIEIDGESSTVARSYVTSVDLLDPAKPRIVDSVAVPGYGHVAHVTPSAAFLASYDWRTDATTVQYVDISDLRGAVSLRDAIVVSGRLSWGERGELQMDFAGGVLRVASEIRATGPEEPSRIRISTVDAADPDELSVLGQLDVGEGHRLLAVRFAGARAYLFHMVQVDPLEVIDLSEPSEPRSLGILPIAGWVERIEVIGDRLVTIGVDDSEDRRVALIVFDVSKGTEPVELGRAVVGGGASWTDATFDLKSFRIIEEQGLVLMPVTGRILEEGEWVYRSWLQLFDLELETGAVAARGSVDIVGRARRALPVADRVVAIGDQQLEVIDATDRGTPVVTASLELARNVTDIVALRDQLAVIVEKSFLEGGGSELRLVPQGSADDLDPLATLELPLRFARVQKLAGDRVVVVGMSEDGTRPRIVVVDAVESRRPVIAGTLDVLGEAGEASGRDWVYLAADSVVAGEALAVVTGQRRDTTLHVVDLGDPRAPVVSRRIGLGGEVVSGLVAEGQRFYLSSYRAVGRDEIDALPASEHEDARIGILPPFGPRTIAQRLRIVDVAEAGAPEASHPISVPGPVLAASPFGPAAADWEVLQVEDAFRAADGTDPARGFDTLLHVGGLESAFLLDLYRLPEDAGRLLVDDDRAVYVRWPWQQDVEPSLHVLDTSLASWILEAGSRTLSDVEYPRLAGFVDAYALVRDFAEVVVYDVVAPARIHEEGRFFAQGWWSERLAYLGDRLLLASGLYGVYDLSW